MRSIHRSLSRLGALLLASLILLAAPRRADAQFTGVVVITEIMYHPAPGSEDLEFIEIHNTSPRSVDLTGWFFSRGIEFQFPDGLWLDGGRYLVICANKDRVREVYGITNVIGDWGIDCDTETPVGCSLANGGETLEISQQPGVAVTSVQYNDRGKWPGAPDGTGHSLEVKTPYSEQDDPDSWSASGAIGGSPGKANDPEEGDLPVELNEAYVWGDGEHWIELFNESLTEEIDLSGFWISDDSDDLRKAQIPVDTKLSPRGFLVLTQSDLPGVELDVDPDGDGDASKVLLSLTRPDGLRVIDARNVRPESPGKTEARIPDGDRRYSDWAEPTPGAPNRTTANQDVVINEILYHPFDLDPDAEFIEIYNRGEAEVDIGGWEFTSGFNWVFAPGTVLAPDAYLVIARNPEYIREVYGLPAGRVLGPDPADSEAVADFGRLRDDGETVRLRDFAGNTVDEVRYHDGGQWPEWADGGGSSLELIDPYQDNGVATAWDASDDSAKAETRRYTHQGSYLTGQPELHLGLAHRGITLVDNLRIFQREVHLEPIETLVAVGDDWKVFPGTEEPSEPRDAWRAPEFDDASWTVGPTPIGYGEDDEGLVLEDMKGNYISFFCRKEFVVTDIGAIRNLVLQLEYDDGLIAYLNGEQIAVENMRTQDDGYEDTFDSRARSSREKVKVDVDLTERLDLLREGTNVLAVQVHNSSQSSSDVRFIASLVNGTFVNVDGPNQLPSGDFESPLSMALRPDGWMIQGTHSRSGITSVGAIDGGGSLKVVAVAKVDNKVNRLEATLPTLVSRGVYTIEFDARWVVGAPTMLVHGHNLGSAAFDYPYSHRLEVPRNLGTPGAINSVTLRQIERTGSSNMGPVIDKVTQTPALPASGEEVQITARVRDPDGVAGVTLFYWIEDSSGRPGPDSTTEVEMAGPDARGRYAATLPGQGLRRRVVFYIVARDAGDRAERYPRDQLSRTHPLSLDPTDAPLNDESFIAYRHDAEARPSNARWQSYRMWLPYHEERSLQLQRLLSNDRKEGSFLFEDGVIYHNTRVRFSGSPWARAGFGGSYRVYLPKDEPLHGSLKRFNMEDHQSGGSRSCLERLSHYLIRHNQGQTRVPFSVQWLVQWQMNDRINTAREHLLAPNRDFVQYWYGDDDEGDMFEVDDRFEINDSGTRQNSIDARWTYPPMRSGDGEDKENYRWFFNTRLKKGLDDYTHLIATAKILDNRITPDALFDEQIWDHIEVEEMLRIWAIRLNTDDWDTWGANRGKNCYLYRPAEDTRWRLFPWDMELTYSNGNAFMPPAITGNYAPNAGKFPEVVRMINRPRIKRMYYGIMQEMVNHQFRSTFLAPFRQRCAAEGLVNTDRMNPSGWIDQRRNRLISILRSAVYPQVRLTVLTNSGDGFATTRDLVVLEGRAPVEVSDIAVLVGGVELETPPAVEFSDADYFRWTLAVPLRQGLNSIELVGLDSRFQEVDSASIEITADIELPAISAVAPEAGREGETVTILGTGLFSGSTVRIHGALAPVQNVVEPDLIEVLVPAGLPPGPGDLVVVSPGGRASEPVSFEVLGEQPVFFVRGDTDLGGNLAITDGVQILGYLFRGESIQCLDAADADDSGTINLTDAIFVLNYLFQGGTAPPAPYPDIGTDPTEDGLDCAGGILPPAPGAP